MRAREEAALQQEARLRRVEARCADDAARDAQLYALPELHALLRHRDGGVGRGQLLLLCAVRAILSLLLGHDARRVPAVSRDGADGYGQREDSP